MSVVLNGWNIDSMNEAVESIKEQPEAGKLAWKSTLNWDSGFGLDIKTNEIEQLGQVMKRSFTIRGDHPQELLGNNTGPTAVETLMAALGSCMGGNFALQATVRGVKIDALKVDLESVIDLNGMFGLKDIRPGISDVKLSFHVKSDADNDTLQEILDAAQSLSPVFDSVSKPVDIKNILVKE
jgi:uncharacterized OsmC-like protein